jgi:hypothetical protein
VAKLISSATHAHWTQYSLFKNGGYWDWQTWSHLEQLDAIPLRTDDNQDNCKTAAESGKSHPTLCRGNTLFSLIEDGGIALKVCRCWLKFLWTK